MNIEENQSIIPAAKVVKVIRNTQFAFKNRPEIAPKGWQSGNLIGVVNEVPEFGEDFNRAIKSVKLEATDVRGEHFVLSKTYNLHGRGAAAFLEDYNAWAETKMTDDDLHESFDGEKDAGKPLVVEVGHRKVGKDWEAYIIGFHPARAVEAPVAS
jgi:hypothetical protein